VAVAVPPEAAAGVPPHNEEAEASVLGAILLTEQALDGVLLEVGLRAHDFYRPRHGAIFQAMIRLKEKATPEAVDALTVAEELRRAGELDKAGGEAYLHSLPTVVPAVGAVLDYARIVKEHSLLRNVLKATREIQDDVAAHRGGARELIERAEAVLFKIGHDGGTSEMRSLEAILHDEIDKLEELSKSDVGLTGTPSGFTDLDSLTGGFQPGNLIVLAARPSMGKSAAATNIAEHAAVEAGVPVALFSLEMSETELAHRFLASQARVSSDDLRKGRVRAEKWPKVLQAVEKLARAPIFVDDSSDMSVLELRAKSRRLAARHGLGLVVVDYLQLMRPEGRPDSSRVEQIGQISRGLKILARELDVPVIAVSQLSRAVESRNPPVPMLSDLRESGCLTGDSRVFLPETGEYTPIAELASRSSFDVIALNTDTWKLERRKVTRAFATGRKPVYRLTTQLGRTIRATGNHKFLAFDGWKRLDEFEVGEHLALPRSLPSPISASMTGDELALLGHLIGDGCTLPRHAIQYTTREPLLARTVADLAENVFGASVRPRIKAERRWYQVYLSSARRLTHGRRNPVAAWLDELGAFGLRSYEKRVPARVFGQPREHIAHFLRHLWSTDGCVYLARGRRATPIVYYATSSPTLAGDVQSLLLRLGINAIRSRVGNARGRPQWHVKLTGASDVSLFLEAVGCLGEERGETGRRIESALAATRPNTNRDVIPAAAWRAVVEPARVAGAVTTRELHAGIGNAYSGSSLYRSNLSRERAARAAAVVESDELARLAASDVYWDRVVSIDPEGVEDVYDLTVEGLHNFVAEDIVVHNSIEQDADVVMFIYRDEYYNKESERLGEADVIVAKHRNGPIGEVALTFLPKYPKFANLYRERAAEPMPSGDGAGDGAF
jgi:replicative DNA helicase